MTEKPSKYLFVTCFIALIATSFGFISRVFLLDEWALAFGLSETQKGEIFGAGLWPFAISIVLFSLVIDRVGYGKALWFAVVTHIASAIWTIYADSYNDLYWAAFVGALGNGTVEAVINPVIATVFRREKTKWLNILHAGWPMGLVLAGTLTIYLGGNAELLGSIMEPLGLENAWQAKVAILLIPVALYALMLPFCRFPISERVAAKVPYKAMLAEAGGLGILIVAAMIIGELGRVVVAQYAAPGTEVPWLGLAIAAGVIALGFAVYVRSLGRPLYILLLLVMLLLATTELGTDGWIKELLKPVTEQWGIDSGWVLVYTAGIMMVLRFLVGPIQRKTGLTPLGLLASSCVFVILGLVALSQIGVDGSAWLLVLGATIYGMGQSFFWPTTLGYVSEQFPRGGALTLNAIAGVGMLGVGIIGGPAIGYVQDRAIEKRVEVRQPGLFDSLAKEKDSSTFFGKYRALDAQAVASAPQEQQDLVKSAQQNAKSDALLQVASLPAAMLVIYLLLILGHRMRGGYKPKELDHEEPASVHEFGAEAYGEAE